MIKYKITAKVTCSRCDTPFIGKVRAVFYPKIKDVARTAHIQCNDCSNIQEVTCHV